MKIFLFCILLLAFSTCQDDPRKKALGFPTPPGLSQAEIVPTDSLHAKTLRVKKPVKPVKVSDLIEEFSYIPLETTDEALIGLHVNFIMYKDYLYILDDILSEAVFIYTRDGKFVKKLGTKGGGPEEFFVLGGMRIDKNKDQLILYNNGRMKMMHYSLQGDFLQSTEIQGRFPGQYEILPSGDMVLLTNKSDGNVHLNDYDDYRLIYTDSIGAIKKFGFSYDDNFFLHIAWSRLFLFENEVLYIPRFLNTVYSVSDTLIRLKYLIDLEDMPQFDETEITTYKSNDEFNKDWNSKANLYPKIAENDTHLYFDVNCQKENYYYFYDKRSENIVGLKQLVFDTHFMIDFPTLYSYKDYFVGTVKAANLKDLKEFNEKKGTPMSPDMAQMVDTLHEEDNDVLVIFKLKEL